MIPALAIPSYQRHNNPIFDKVKDLAIPKYIYVRPEEVQKYSHHKQFTIVPLPGVTNIGETRRDLVADLAKRGYEYAFMFDDDISKVEMLIPTDTGWNSARIVNKEEAKPRFELSALQSWFKWHRSNSLSLSSPIPRFNRKDKGRHHINCRDCIACVLMHIPSVIQVGNYSSTREVGAEDMFLQYQLLTNGYTIGNYGYAEYDTPKMGLGTGGNNAVEETDLAKRYTAYVDSFFKTVGETRLVTKKLTKTGTPSIKFVWKELNNE